MSEREIPTPLRELDPKKSENILREREAFDHLYESLPPDRQRGLVSSAEAEAFETYNTAEALEREKVARETEKLIERLEERGHVWSDQEKKSDIRDATASARPSLEAYRNADGKQNSWQKRLSRVPKRLGSWIDQPVSSYFNRARSRTTEIAGMPKYWPAKATAGVVRGLIEAPFFAGFLALKGVKRGFDSVLDR